MTKIERNNWLSNIEDTAVFITGMTGEAVVNATLYKYGVRSIRQIPNSYLSEIFSELYAIEADLRSDL